MSLFIRYTLWIIVLLLLICLMRLTFLESSKEALWRYINPIWKNLFDGLISAPIYASAAFGAGWGAIISLSSYNKFNTNIMRYSWIACVGQLLIFILFGLVVNLIDSNLEKLAGFRYYYHIEENWILYLSSGWVMSNLKFPNIWCILFFSTLTLSALLMMAIQLFSILTTVFDEFERLRYHKQKVTFGLIGFIFLNSIYFCSNHGLKVLNVLSYDVIFSQTLLNLLLLLIVLWIYGRERFQWDFQFMLRQTFETWRVHMLRFVAAAVMLYTLVLSAMSAVQEHMFRITYTQALVVFLIALFAIFLPCLLLPGYAQWRMSRVKGSFRLRFKRCCQPADWYPVEAENHQRYKDLIKNANVLQPISAAGDTVSEI